MAHQRLIAFPCANEQCHQDAALQSETADGVSLQRDGPGQYSVQRHISTVSVSVDPLPFTQVELQLAIEGGAPTVRTCLHPCFSAVVLSLECGAASTDVTQDPHRFETGVGCMEEDLEVPDRPVV